MVWDLNLSATSEDTRAKSATITAAALINTALDHMGLCLSGLTSGAMFSHVFCVGRVERFCVLFFH